MERIIHSATIYFSSCYFCRMVEIHGSYSISLSPAVISISNNMNNDTNVDNTQTQYTTPQMFSRKAPDVVSIRMLSIVIGYVEVILSYVIICHQARIIAFLVEKTCEEKLQNSSVFGGQE